jgi:hypothetical protein
MAAMDLTSQLGRQTYDQYHAAIQAITKALNI